MTQVCGVGAAHGTAVQVMVEATVVRLVADTELPERAGNCLLYCNRPQQN